MIRPHFDQIVSCRGEQLLLPHRPAEIDTSSYCGQVEGELKPGSHYRTDPEGTAPRDQITKQSGKPLKLLNRMVSSSMPPLVNRETGVPRARVGSGDTGSRPQPTTTLVAKTVLHHDLLLLCFSVMYDLHYLHTVKFVKII